MGAVGVVGNTYLPYPFDYAALSGGRNITKKLRRARGREARGRQKYWHSSHVMADFYYATP